MGNGKYLISDVKSLLFNKFFRINFDVKLYYLIPIYMDY